MEKLSIDKKVLLSLKEAAEYSGLGMNTLRHRSDKKDCDFVFWIGIKRMFKREKLRDFLVNTTRVETTPQKPESYKIIRKEIT